MIIAASSLRRMASVQTSDQHSRLKQSQYAISLPELAGRPLGLKIPYISAAEQATISIAVSDETMTGLTETLKVRWYWRKHGPEQFYRHIARTLLRNTVRGCVIPEDT